MNRPALLSFDTEEFDIPLEYGVQIPTHEQMEVGRRGLAAVLRLLDELDIAATFFTTASFALACPGMIRGLAPRHEVASHGFTHAALAEGDLLRSRLALEEIRGRAVRGFRRARLAATDHAEVSRAGYTYNSSEHPTFLPGRYNNLAAPRRPYFTGDLLNIPVSVVPVVRFPLFWLTTKNLPLPAIKSAAGATLRADGAINLYAHPWEFADLRAYRLPWYVKRPDGVRLVERYRRYLSWLKRRATFVTFGDFEAQLRGRR